MGETISQRVNALFAAYVANELEQDRLGRAGDDAGAQALCAPTIAIREQVFAIRDRTGCPDLIAARLLLDLMLVTRWNDDGGPQIGFEDQETVLPVLEILADHTTGTVRQQAAKALATIGIEVSTSPTMGDMLGRAKAARQTWSDTGHESDISPSAKNKATFAQAQDDYNAAIEALMRHRPATVEEAGDRLAWLWSFGGPWDGLFPSDEEIALLLGSMVTAGRPSQAGDDVATQPDPLALLLTDYREALDAHNAADLPDDVAEEVHAAATYRPLYERIETNCPTPTTLAGVREALRLALNREMGDAMPRFAESLLRAALAHLEGRG